MDWNPLQMCGPERTRAILGRWVGAGRLTRGPEADIKWTRGASVSCPCGRKPGPNLWRNCVHTDIEQTKFGYARVDMVLASRVKTNKNR